MLAARTCTPVSLIPEVSVYWRPLHNKRNLFDRVRSVSRQTFGPAKIHIPRAPALGLLLEQPQFGSYNSRVAESNAEARRRFASELTEGPEDTSAKDGSASFKHKIEFEHRRDVIEVFKRDYIYAAMRVEEAKNRM